MLSNFSQYSPQGMSAPFPGLQAAGFPGYPTSNPAQFGFNGPFGNAPGYDSAQFGPAQQQSFGAQPFGAQSPWLGQNPFAALTANPYLQGPHAGNSFAHHPVQQIVPVLGQIAQQVAIQSAVTQQIGVALHQLAHHLALQSLQGQQGIGFGGAQGFGAFNPQAQVWGANRSSTIQ
jgi:hypothetical protein